MKNYCNWAEINVVTLQERTETVPQQMRVVIKVAQILSSTSEPQRKENNNNTDNCCFKVKSKVLICSAAWFCCSTLQHIKAQFKKTSPQSTNFRPNTKGLLMCLCTTWFKNQTLVFILLWLRRQSFWSFYLPHRAADLILHCTSAPLTQPTGLISIIPTHPL